MELIAEGVETEAERAFLAAKGCTNYQGYLFYRPISWQEFTAVFADEMVSVQEQGCHS